MAEKSWQSEAKEGKGPVFDSQQAESYDCWYATKKGSPVDEIWKIKQ